MSGYPYGNPAGDYPAPYATGNSAYPPYPAYPPPPIPMYANNQPFASPYGMPTPQMSSYDNYLAPSYGGNQTSGNPYDYGRGNDYQSLPPPGGQMPSPMLNQPPQQYG
ncbi:unnamed protein product, partial [Rotaria socialis]